MVVRGCRKMHRRYGEKHREPRLSCSSDSCIVMNILPLIENDSFSYYHFLCNGCCVMNVICMHLSCR
jgi:hypothetical protein